MNIVQWLIMTQLSEANKNYTIKYNAPPLNGSLSLSLSPARALPASFRLCHHTLVESATFAPGSKTRMWYFRPGYGEIVDYICT